MNGANSNAPIGRSKEAPQTGMNEGPVSQNAWKLINHNISFLFIRCCRCICNARPLAHPVRWGSVSESWPAVDHPYEGTTRSATAAASKPCSVPAADGHARFWPWHPAYSRPAGEKDPACRRGALTSEQHSNNQSPLYTEKLEDKAKKKVEIEIYWFVICLEFSLSAVCLLLCDALCIVL